MRTTFLRNLAFVGFVATGCAAQSLPNVSPNLRSTPGETRPDSQSCRRQRTRIQNCIVEGVVTQCRSANPVNEDQFVSCVSNALGVSRESSTRQVSVTVSTGDEVFSMRSGGSVVMDLVRLEVSTVDQTGVGFIYNIERIAATVPTQRTPVENVEVRLNFDGTRNGPWAVLNGLEVYNFRVERTDSSSATVRFSTDDPRILIKASQ